MSCVRTIDITQRIDSLFVSSKCFQHLEGNQSLADFPFVSSDAVLTSGHAITGFDFGFPTVGTAGFASRNRSVWCSVCCTHDFL